MPPTSPKLPPTAEEITEAHEEADCAAGGDCTCAGSMTTTVVVTDRCADAKCPVCNPPPLADGGCADVDASPEQDAYAEWLEGEAESDA